MSTPTEYTISEVSCFDLCKSHHPISTGIGFFDHMIDQFNSHAQIGVSVTVTLADDTATATATSTSSCPHDAVENINFKDNKNRFAYPITNQAILMKQVGSALGKEFHKLLNKKNLLPGTTSRFCCPLDEALVECILSVPSPHAQEEGTLTSFNLQPYGIYPKLTGRTKIGHMSTQQLQTFFVELAKHSGLIVQIHKFRGDNGHHVVESAFKAFSRALRNLLDGVDTTIPDDDNNAETGGGAIERMWGINSESYKVGLNLCRMGQIKRQTKETSILVELQMDGMKAGITVDTGIATLNDLMVVLVTEARMSLNAKCSGDLWVDDHHTSEDVAIALGQVLNQAFGTKAGLNRMWCAVGRNGDAEVEVVMDLSNRPCFTHNLSLSSNPNCEEYIGDLSVEMLEHALHSLVMNGQMTVHIIERKPGATLMETAMATFSAFGKALKFCAAVDPRRAGKTASSKGTLSV